MKHKLIFIFLAIVLTINRGFSQIERVTEDILNEIKADIIATDSDTSKLITSTGFNVFIQRKALNYLTGVSDLSLAKFYSSYSDKDKLNLGFNLPVLGPKTRRLAFVFNPILVADVKNNFSTLRKDGKWNNDIRGGLKVTWLIPFKTMNFLSDMNINRANDLRILRTKKYNELKEKFKNEIKANTNTVRLINGLLEEPTNAIISNNKMKKKKSESFEGIGIAEADYLEEEKAYTWLQTAWFSAWALFPITEAEKFVSIDNSQPFEKTKFELWEINFQFTYLTDFNNIGTFYFSPWIRCFQNNSANADLMTTVDYGQYSQFPGINLQNLALLESSKAYIGTYEEFMTTNFNFQVVYITPFQNTLIKPGLSFRFEKNWGNFSPANLRFGLPLNIQGKKKPINFELQYRINDIYNYMSKQDHKPKRTVGISLGLPISLLYK